MPWLLGWSVPGERTTFAAGLHAGSCAGLLAALAPWREPGTALLAGATCVPAAVAGLLAHDVVERRLGRPEQVAVLLAAAGAALAAADRRPEVRDVGPREAVLAAPAQVAALAPGVSRSGAALTALRAAGVRRAQAQRFSLLMSLPVTAGAAGLTLARTGREGWTALAVPLGVGVPAAAVAGFTAASGRRGAQGPAPTWSALYRLGIAAVVLCTSRRRRSR